MISFTIKNKGQLPSTTSKNEEEKVITYTDYVGILMGSVTTIVDVIGYVLIAFVSISVPKETYTNMLSAALYSGSENSLF